MLDFNCFCRFFNVAAGKQPRRWSVCTKEKLRMDFEVGNLDACLKNKPEILQKVGSTSVCGNFFVEEGKLVAHEAN